MRTATDNLHLKHTGKGTVRRPAATDRSAPHRWQYDTLEPRVVCGQHGWWQACPDIGAPGDDSCSPDGANLNLIIGNTAIDPISGSVPHRAYLFSRDSLLQMAPPRTRS
jgi:hypothetical protein